MTDHTQLRKVAEAATPGPWMRLFGERIVYDRMEDGCKGTPLVETPHSPPTRPEAADLNFIAAANPKTVLELLDEIERLKKDAARYRWLKRNSGVSFGISKPKLTLISTCPAYGDESEVSNIEAAIDAAMLK